MIQSKSFIIILEESEIASYNCPRSIAEGRKENYHNYRKEVISKCQVMSDEVKQFLKDNSGKGNLIINEMFFFKTDYRLDRYDVDNLSKPFTDCLQKPFGFNDKQFFTKIPMKFVSNNNYEYIVFSFLVDDTNILYNMGMGTTTEDLIKRELERLNKLPSSVSVTNKRYYEKNKEILKEKERIRYHLNKNKDS